MMMVLRSCIFPFAKQNPFVAVFLELRQVAEDDAVHGDLPRGVLRPRNRRVFSKANLVHLDGDGIPFSEEDDLFVLRDLHFEGGFLISDHAPQRFELSSLPWAHPLLRGLLRRSLLCRNNDSARTFVHSCYMTSPGSQNKIYKFFCSLEHCMVEMEVCMVAGLAPQTMLSLILLRGAMAMMGLTLMKRLWWRSWQLFEKKPTTPRMRSGVSIAAY